MFGNNTSFHTKQFSNFRLHQPHILVFQKNLHLHLPIRIGIQQKLRKSIFSYCFFGSFFHRFYRNLLCRAIFKFYIQAYVSGNGFSASTYLIASRFSLSERFMIKSSHKYSSLGNSTPSPPLLRVRLPTGHGKTMGGNPFQRDVVTAKKVRVSADQSGQPASGV